MRKPSTNPSTPKREVVADESGQPRELPALGTEALGQAQRDPYRKVDGADDGTQRAGSMERA